MKLIVLAIAVLMYVLVIVFPKKKAWITLGAGLVILITGAVSPWTAISQLINWNVLMIYVGSLAIAELFLYSRVPILIADVIVSKSPNAGIAIVAILIMTGFISAFVENVATVLVMAPIALALCKKLKIDPTYFMVGLAVMANLQGTATLVGDPPSMIFASFAGYTFNDFFISGGKISIFFFVQIGMIAGALFFYAYFAKIGKEKVVVDDKEKYLSLFPTVLLILMIIGLALSSFVPGDLHFFSGSLVMILGIIGIFWFRFTRKESDENTVKLIKGLDWETIAFLIGIFVVIGSVASTGILEDFAGFLSGIIGGNVLAGFVIIIVVSVVLSGFIDNVPYIIVMLPVASSLAQGLGLKPELYMFALLIGSCLGGNLSPFGASANIVAMGILKKNGVTLTFPGWLKIGLPFTLITTFASVIVLWFVWK
ncbi:MAG: anion permease [Spirochaetaceae bacterium]|nr:anion permease [Spirochaetaceae bacterium]